MAKEKNHGFFEEDATSAQEVASLQECTGLMQTPHEDAVEVESLQEIYDVPLSKRRKGEGWERQDQDHVDPDGL